MAIYDAKPSKYEAVGNGSYLYRWNIEEIQVPENGDSETTVSKWQCDEVTIWMPLSANKVVKAVIEHKWGNDHEQKLVNEYNSALLDIYDENTATEKINAYKTFLNERKELKEKVEEDYNECFNY